MKKWIISGVLTAVVLGGAGFAWANRPVPVQQATGPGAASTVRVAKADLANLVEFKGTLGYGAATTLKGHKAGMVTWLPAVGTIVEPGQTLYKVDDRPIVLFTGDTPLFRKLETPGTRGPDVKVVNKNLNVKGDEFTSATVNAIKKWQKSLKIAETGVIEPGDVVVLPAKVRVDATRTALGESAAGELLSLTGPDRAVAVEVPSDQVDIMKVDTRVTVIMTDGKQVDGTVKHVGTTATQSSEGGKNDAPKVVATVNVEAGDAVAGPVRVKVPSESKQGVLTVPVGALVALKEGGYALQRKEGSYVPVQTGMFANGLVEVSGDITEGMEVVTTS